MIHNWHIFSIWYKCNKANKTEIRVIIKLLQDNYLLKKMQILRTSNVKNDRIIKTIATYNQRSLPSPSSYLTHYF